MAPKPFETLQFNSGFVGGPTDPAGTVSGCPIFENGVIDLDGESARSAYGYLRVLLNKLENTGTKAAHNGMMIIFFDAGLVYRSPGIGIAIVDYKNTSPDRRVVALGYNPFLKPTDYARSSGTFWDPSTTPVLIVYSYPRTTAHEYPTILNVGRQTFIYAHNCPTLVLDDKGLRPSALMPPSRKPILIVAATSNQARAIGGASGDAAWTALNSATVSKANTVPLYIASSSFYYNKITPPSATSYVSLQLAKYNGVSFSIAATDTHIGIFFYYESLTDILPAGTYSLLFATADDLGGTVHVFTIDKDLMGGMWHYYVAAKPSTMSGAVTVESVGLRINRECKNVSRGNPPVRIGGQINVIRGKSGPFTGKWRAAHTNYAPFVKEESDPSPYTDEFDFGTAGYSAAYYPLGYRGFWDTTSNSLVDDPVFENAEILGPGDQYGPVPYQVTKSIYPDTCYHVNYSTNWANQYAQIGNGMSLKIYMHQVGSFVTEDDTALFYCLNNDGSTIVNWTDHANASTPYDGEERQAFTITNTANGATSLTLSNIIVDDPDEIQTTGDELYPYFGVPPACRVATSIGGRVFAANAKQHDYTTTATVVRGRDFIKLASLSSELWVNETNYGQPMELTYTSPDFVSDTTKTYEIIRASYASTNNVFVRLGAIPTELGEYADQIKASDSSYAENHEGIGQSTTARVRVAGRKNRVWFSHKSSRFGSQPQYFPSLNYFDIDMDGDEIMGIDKAGDAILIFGRNGVWRCYYDEDALDDDPEAPFPISGITRLDGSPGLVASRSLRKTGSDSFMYLGEGNTLCEGGSAGTQVNRALSGRCRDYLAGDGEADMRYIEFAHATFDRASNIYTLYLIDDDGTNSTPTFPSAVLDTATPTEDFTKGLIVNLNSNTLSTLRFEKNKSSGYSTATRARFAPTCSLEITTSYGDTGINTRRIYVGDRFGYVYTTNEYAYSWGAPARSTNFANGQQRLRYVTDHTEDSGGYTNGWNSSTKTLKIATGGLVTDGDGIKDLTLMIRTFDASNVEGSEYHRIVSNTTDTITLHTSLTNSVSVDSGTRVMIGVIEPTIEFRHRVSTRPVKPMAVRPIVFNEEGLSHIQSTSQKFQYYLRMYKAFADSTFGGWEDFYADMSVLVQEMEITQGDRRRYQDAWIPIGSAQYGDFSSRVLVYRFYWEQEAGRQILRRFDVREALSESTESLNANT